MCIHVVIYDNMAIYDTWTQERPSCIFLQSHWPTEYSFCPSSANGTSWLERANIARFQESRTCRSTATSARKASRCSDAPRSLQCIRLFACSIPIGVGVSAQCDIHAMWIETPEQTEQTEQTAANAGKKIQKSRGLCNKAHFSFQHRRGKN